LRSLGLAAAAEVGAGEQVFLHGEVLEDVPALHAQRKAHLDPGRCVEVGDVLPVEDDRAVGDLAVLGGQQPGDRLESRRLAGAVGAQQRDDLALRAPRATARAARG
jgi:hypothetical protein